MHPTLRSFEMSVSDCDAFVIDSESGAESR